MSLPQIDQDDVLLTGVVPQVGRAERDRVPGLRDLAAALRLVDVEDRPRRVDRLDDARRAAQIGGTPAVAGRRAPRDGDAVTWREPGRRRLEGRLLVRRNPQAGDGDRRGVEPLRNVLA